MGDLGQRAAFLDRDGTLNVGPDKHEYISSAEDFQWLPGAPEAVALLASADYFVGVVSNQRGVALGTTTETTLREIEDRIQCRLRSLGCSVDVFRYCLHDLDAGCSCRKPAPGLLLSIGAEFGVDLSRSWMIGDDEVDVLAGRAAGCRTGLIGRRRSIARPDIEADTLLETSRILTK